MVHSRCGENVQQEFAKFFNLVDYLTDEGELSCKYKALTIILTHVRYYLYTGNFIKSNFFNYNTKRGKIFFMSIYVFCMYD
jgi:hypothetical protein